MSPLVQISFIAQGRGMPYHSKDHHQVKRFAGCGKTVDWTHVPREMEKVFLRLRTGPDEFTGAWFHVSSVMWAETLVGEERTLTAIVEVVYYCDEGSTEGGFR